MSDATAQDTIDEKMIDAAMVLYEEQLKASARIMKKRLTEWKEQGVLRSAETFAWVLVQACGTLAAELMLRWTLISNSDPDPTRLGQQLADTFVEHYVPLKKSRAEGVPSGSTE